MINFGIWGTLGIISLILLIVYRKTKNALWGGLTIGITIGLVIAIIFMFIESSFDWLIVGKSAITGTMIGFVAELLGKLSDYLKNKKI